MKKKMIIAGVFVCALAITASAVFASVRTSNNNCCDSRDRNSQTCCPSVEVNADSNASVRNNVTTRANSGSNFVTAGYFSSADVDTGAALSQATVGNDVEGAIVTVDAPSTGKVVVNADSNARVTNNVRTSANSGRNVAVGGKSDTDTGSATAGANVQTKVYGSTVEVK
jgi:hypothetical protein